MVPMMYRKGCYYHYCQGDGFQALDMPYEGWELSMLIVLPTKKDGLAALETRFASEGMYQQVVDGLYQEEGILVSLARLKMATECSLKPVLSALCVELAF